MLHRSLRVLISLLSIFAVFCDISPACQTLLDNVQGTLVNIQDDTLIGDLNNLTSDLNSIVTAVPQIQSTCQGLPVTAVVNLSTTQSQFCDLDLDQMAEMVENINQNSTPADIVTAVENLMNFSGQFYNDCLAVTYTVQGVSQLTTDLSQLNVTLTATNPKSS